MRRAACCPQGLGGLDDFPAGARRGGRRLCDCKRFSFARQTVRGNMEGPEVVRRWRPKRNPKGRGSLTAVEMIRAPSPLCNQRGAGVKNPIPWLIVAAVVGI